MRKRLLSHAVLFAVFLLPVLSGCKSDTEGDSNVLKAVKVPGLAYEAEEDSDVNLADFVLVTGGRPPYSYSYNTVEANFSPAITARIPSLENSSAVYNIYIRDSQGSMVGPFVIRLTIKKRELMPDTPAFPGAEGGGRFTTGGRGGNVYYVTNLEDGPSPGPAGSLRYALTRPAEAKTIVFKVSGEIKLKSHLQIRGDGSNSAWGKNITIAGETAPGDGICLSGYSLQIFNTDNVIIRFMRFRYGDEHRLDGDAAEGRTSSNVILDHCSFSWGIDEQASFYAMRNFTMQWCIITEALRTSYSESGESHGFGGIWGGQNCSYHHNLVTRCDSRNPRPVHRGFFGSSAPFDLWGGYFDIRNNLFYGWGSQVAYAGEGQEFNMVGNTYKEGPKSSKRNYFFQAYFEGEPLFPGALINKYPIIYMSGNEYYTYNVAGPQPLTSINSNNYAGIIYAPVTGYTSPPQPTPPSQEFPITGVRGNDHTTTHSAKNSHDLVLAKAGAWPRDKVDNRAATDATNNTTTYGGSTTPSNDSFNKGMIDTPSNVGGMPTYQSVTAPVDTDEDGLPDAWETAKGLNPNDKTDGRKYSAGSPYTNLEVYLHSLAAELVESAKSNTY